MLFQWSLNVMTMESNAMTIDARDVRKVDGVSGMSGR